MLNDDLLISQQIDKFKVLRHIGRGGMADVYLAQDTALGRQVVLKLMLPVVALDEQLIARFQREAQTTARLEHPNIVQIYSIGQTVNGQPYLALQYVSGGSLSEFLQNVARQEKWISTPYALTIAAQMARALSAAHSVGIVHRDMKPSNILLREDGTAVLSDLGIAAVHQESTRLTRTGGVLGTPHYMSPEQALGHPVDGRSDFYSLGIILYELLAKRPPFEADSPLAIVHQQVYEQPFPLEQLRPGLAQDTYKVVRICLQKDPEARYQNASQLSAALEQALIAEGAVDSAAPTIIDTPPLGTPSTARTLAELAEKKRPLWLIVPIAVLLLIFLLGAGVVINNLINSTQTNGPGDPVEVPSTVPTDSGSGVVVANTPTSEPTATTAPTITASPSPSPEPSQPPTATATVIPEFAPIEPLPGSGPVRMTSSDSTEMTPILSPDQRALLFQSDRSGTWQIYTMDVNGGDWRQLTNNSANNFHPHYSPDGERIIFTTNKDGNYEIYSMSEDGQDLRRITNSSYSDQYPSFSPDGEWITYLSKRDNGWGAYMMRADGSADRAIIDTGADETYPVFSPDGQSVAFQSNQTGNHDIFTIPWTGGSPRQLTFSSARDANPVYSPDGQWIAFESDRNGNYDIYVVRTDGTDLRNLTNHSARDQLPAFSADGQWLLFQSDRDGSVDIHRQPFEY